MLNVPLIICRFFTRYLHLKFYSFAESSLAIIYEIIQIYLLSGSDNQ